MVILKLSHYLSTLLTGNEHPNLLDVWRKKPHTTKQQGLDFRHIKYVVLVIHAWNRRFSRQKHLNSRIVESVFLRRIMCDYNIAVEKLFSWV